MRFVCKTKIEKAWLVASVIIFITHRMLEVSSQSYYDAGNPLQWWLEVAMLALSFPLGGLTLIVLQNAMYWCGDCRDLVWMFDSSTLLFAGYIQWFWLLPEFLRNRKPTRLDLSRTPETISPNASPAIAEPATPGSFVAALPGNSDADTLPAFTAAFTPRLAEFDEAGLTALDRVFQAQASPPARQSPPPRVEAIFPRAG